MTLAFSEQNRGSVGKKTMRAYSVTLDGSTSEITAANIGLHYIDSAMITGVSIASNIAPLLCTFAGTSLVLEKTHANGDLLNLWVWGF